MENPRGFKERQIDDKQTISLRISKAVRSGVKGALLLVAIIVGIGVVQMFYFQTKDVPSAILAESYPSLDGISRFIVAHDNYTLVYVFAPWCGVCKVSASNLNSLDGNFNILALGLSYYHDSEVRSFVDQTRLKVPVILGQGKLEETLNIGQFPTYFVLDEKGKIVLGWSGYTTTVGLWLRLWGVKLLGTISPSH